MAVILGIDEVGRGSWAGPLVAGAVVLTVPINGIRDSKKISRSRREDLANTIKILADSWALGWVQPHEINVIGLTEAVRLAMKRAKEQIICRYDEVIIDGNFNYLSTDVRSRAVVKADETITAVSAASIIAKVARDAYMREQATIYPSYGFETHVGYGTKQHAASLRLYGVCPLHRRNYKPIKAIINSF